MTASELSGLRALVVGLGSFGGGAGTARFLHEAGAQVTVTDLRGADGLEEALGALAGLPVRTVLGEHRAEDFAAADLVVPNPAVRPDHPLLALARSAGARVVSAIELFLERVPGPVCAVTGTQGKSSTTSMLAQLLSAAGMSVRAGGNLGGSLLPELRSWGAETVSVLELSSYQLEALTPEPPAGRVRVAAITNVLADHLERHGSREAYAAAKARILELLDGEGTAVLPGRGLALEPGRARVLRFGEECELRVAGGRFLLGEEVLGRVDDLRLPGAFQRENALVALGAARRMGASAEALRAAVPRLTGLPHRLEDLGVVRGRRVWDNGVSTTPDSTASALESLGEPCILVAGGQAKRDLPWDPLVAAARGRVRLAALFGRAGPELAEALAASGAAVLCAADVGGAVALAFAEGERGRPVLFSPACASFDAYPNFAARARAFRAAIDALRTGAAAVEPPSRPRQV